MRRIVALVALAALAGGTTTSGPVSAKSLFELFVGSSPDELTKNAAAALGLVAEQSIDKFITGMDQWSDDAIRNGSNQGKLLMVQGGNEARLVVGAIRSEFGAELGKKVKDASEELRPLLVELQKWRVAQGDLATSLVALEDTVAMDLERVPFSPKYFGIRRVYGTVLVPGDQAGLIRIVGPSFGSVVAGQEITVSADLNGTDLGKPTLIPPDSVAWDVPKGVLDAFVADDGKTPEGSIKTLPLKITMKKVEHGWIRYWDTVSETSQDLRVVLLPRLVGTIVAVTERPKYEWQAGDVVSEPQTITVDTPFVLSVARPIGTIDPIEGTQRFIEGSVKAICGPVERPGYRFPKRDVLESDSLFKTGWVWSRWVGADPKDWDEANRDLKQDLGLEISFWSWKGGHRCDQGVHCFLTPDELRSLGTLVKMSVSDCNRLNVDPGSVFNFDRSQVTAWVRGHGLVESQWTVSAQTEVYKEVGTETEKAAAQDVIAGETFHIDIKDAAGTSTELAFAPRNGPARQGLVGQDIPDGPHFIRSEMIGNHIQRNFYSYTYANANWQ